MRRKLFFYPDKGISLEEKGPTTTSLEGSPSIPKESLRCRLEGFLPNTNDIKKYSAKKNRRGYPNTLFGITPSNYSQGPLPRYPDDSFPLPKAKLLKHKDSWPNT